MIKRKNTRQINLGGVKIGGNAPVSIQSMTKTGTQDIKATLSQIKGLKVAGCEIIRIAVKDDAAAKALKEIMKKSALPVEADIHFNYKLAIASMENGVDGIRLNPGNIYRKEEIAAVVKEARKKRIPIRVGVNSGSLKLQSGRSLSERMAKSALDYVKILEKMNFRDIMISLKCSDVESTVRSYRLIAERCEYPLHLGVTAAGLPETGAIKSAIGIGALLLDGIGDTIRVSLAGDPAEEVKVAKEILSAIGLRHFGPELLVCPTCGRTEINVIGLAVKLEKELSKLSTVHGKLITQPLKVAVMGCVVNGPGEAKEADIGIAGGKGSGVLFRKGKVIGKVKEKDFLKTLLKYIIK